MKMMINILPFPFDDSMDGGNDILAVVTSLVVEFEELCFECPDSFI